MNTKNSKHSATKISCWGFPPWLTNESEELFILVLMIFILIYAIADILIKQIKTYRLLEEKLTVLSGLSMLHQLTAFVFLYFWLIPSCHYFILFFFLQTYIYAAVFFTYQSLCDDQKILYQMAIKHSLFLFELKLITCTWFANLFLMLLT